jgi:hypothetical protein
MIHLRPIARETRPRRQRGDPNGDEQEAAKSDGRDAAAQGLVVQEPVVIEMDFFIFAKKGFFFHLV